jgi:hypothetical protein
MQIRFAFAAEPLDLLNGIGEKQPVMLGRFNSSSR